MAILYNRLPAAIIDIKALTLTSNANNQVFANVGEPYIAFETIKELNAPQATHII